MTNEEFFAGVERYVSLARKELHARWDQWSLDPDRAEMHEVLGALMARQVTLTTHLALNPGLWNGHVAPLFLRAMIDVYITFAWICEAPEERSQKFISYGLGQEKLHLEHFKNAIRGDVEDVESHPAVEARRSWINSQRYTFLTEVDVGSWSGKSTRAMADEAGCMSIYRHAYQPFSSAAHSMWNHVGRYNLQPCENALHGYHLVPIDTPLEIDVDYLYRSAKYVNKTFDKFDSVASVGVEADSCFLKLVDLIDTLDEEGIESADIDASDQTSA